MPLASEKLRVQIYGHDYELDPGGLTPLEASQLAAYVDRKMREIADSLGLVDTQKIAVLAALNIAFEMGSRNAAPAGLARDDETKIKAMVAVLDGLLSP
jgi:cell division protein ZapA (FtsZ GTPase activity inhibitor)